MSEQLPKVLVVSTNAWRDNTGINTLIEFFKCWTPARLAQIYTRSTLPNTSVCNEFFRISENAVMKSVLKRGIKTGSRVQNERTGDLDSEAKAEESMYSHRGKGAGHFLSFCRELVWLLGKWRTKELDTFLEECSPDVLFIPVYPTIYMGRIQKYIIKKTKKPVVSYLADDNYTYKSVRKHPIAILERFFLRKHVKYIVDHSSQLMVIVPKQKEVYDNIFGTDSAILTKGIDFSEIPFEPKPVSNPIKMVYTGKLIIGRWKSLSAIAEALGKINADGVKAELDIYTTDILTDEQKKALNRNGCAVKGALPLSEVQKVQRDADVLIFVESLERKYKYTAWLSFSTKITDYLKNGRCIFAIGDKEISPIDYFSKYSSAITATNYDEIGKKLQELVAHPAVISEMAKRAYNCGVEHHSKETMNVLLTKTLIEAAQNEM